MYLVARIVMTAATIGAIHAQEIRGRVFLAEQNRTLKPAGAAVVYALRLNDKEFASNVRIVEEYASESSQQAASAADPNATNYQKRVMCLSILLAIQLGTLSWEGISNSVDSCRQERGFHHICPEWHLYSTGTWKGRTL